MGSRPELLRAESTRERSQIFTPDPVALLMVSLIATANAPIRVLDPGAGHGTLTEHFVYSLPVETRAKTQATLVESDPVLALGLRSDAEGLTAGASSEVVETDFIAWALEKRQTPTVRFTHVVMNPPYLKMLQSSDHGRALRSAGIQVSNYYAAFLWLGLDLLDDDGQLVAIVPRSFCNGRLFKRLRERILESCSIESLTVFDDRGLPFGRDGVLQETVIIVIRKTLRQDPVTINWASGKTASVLETTSVPIARIIDVSDLDRRIRVPANANVASRNDRDLQIPVLLEGMTASTGSVVDFRMVSVISSEDTNDVVPLIGSEVWSDFRRRALRFLRVENSTLKHIYPAGWYVVVKRVSPTEQRPRIRAAIVGSDNRAIAFENHVNVIHKNREPMSLKEANETLARLESQSVQDMFLELSGSTQVNVSDINALRIPATHERHENGE